MRIWAFALLYLASIPLLAQETQEAPGERPHADGDQGVGHGDGRAEIDPGQGHHDEVGEYGWDRAFQQQERDHEGEVGHDGEGADPRVTSGDLRRMWRTVVWWSPNSAANWRCEAPSRRR